MSRLAGPASIAALIRDPAPVEPTSIATSPSYRNLVDGDVGVIRRLQPEPDLYHDEPKFLTYRADVSETAGFSDGGYEYCTAAGGRGIDAAEAELKALFEGLERYSLSIYRRRDQRRGTYWQLSDDGEWAVDPAKLINAVSPEAVRQARTARLYWVLGWSLRLQRAIWVPAQTVYLPYAADEDEPYLRDPVTTGAAAGVTLASAIIRAVLELVERDALMLRHYAEIVPNRIGSGDVHSESAKALFETASCYRLRLDAFQMSLDMPINVVAVRLRDDTGLGPATVLGAKAHENRDEAFIGAFLEAATFRRQLRDRLPALQIRGREILGGGRPIEAVEDRAALWSLPEYADRLSYLDRAVDVSAVAPLGPSDASLSRLLSAVAEAAGDLVVVDVTTPDIAQEGVVVVRVVAVSLQWMHLAEDGAVWSARLASHTVGRERNPVPHPYV